MKKQRFRTELEELRKIQEMFNERQRQELEEENKRIAQFLVDLDRKEAERKRIAEENKKNSGEFVERMCAELTEAAVSMRFFLNETIFFCRKIGKIIRIRTNQGKGNRINELNIGKKT